MVDLASPEDLIKFVEVEFTENKTLKKEKIEATIELRKAKARLQAVA